MKWKDANKKLPKIGDEVIVNYGVKKEILIWTVSINNSTMKVKKEFRWCKLPIKDSKEPNYGLKMVLVKGGTFKMGCDNGGDGEKPIHTVTVDDFHIGRYEVTQEEWNAVMGNNPSDFKGDNLPVEQVSWNDIQQFLRKLNQKTGENYRLPTEAEWEYACRGGIQSASNKYSGSNNLTDVAWYNGNSNRRTHHVGTKQPNELGIYDMSGNVWEWCNDWYGANYYKDSPSKNPKGPNSGTNRVLRGGAWTNSPYFCSDVLRNVNIPGYHDYTAGFRLAKDGIT